MLMYICLRKARFNEQSDLSYLQGFFADHLKIVKAKKSPSVAIYSISALQCAVSVYFVKIFLGR